MIKLGSEVKDEMTGLKGIAVGRAEYLYGCATIWVQPKGLNNGEKKEAVWIDEQRIVVLKPPVIKISKDSSATSGGPQGVPSRSHPR